MLRMKPSVITLTPGEVTDAEHRLRFRRHLGRAAAMSSINKNSLRTEQNRETRPGQQIASSSRSTFKHSPHGGIRRALESWRPQPSAASTPLDTDESTTVWEQEQSASPTEPRLLQLSPRRLGASMPPNWPHHSESNRQPSTESDNYSTTTGAASVQDATVDEPPHRRTNTADLTQATRLMSPTIIASPELPPPFSRFSRAHSATRAAAPTADDDSDNLATDTDSAHPVNLHTSPPETPIRRSSLNIRLYIRSLDGPGEVTLNRADEPVMVSIEPVSTRTRSRRYQAPTPRVSVNPTTPPRASERFSLEAAPEAPSTGIARLRIYNDSVPRSFQPETPQNLPESRHQSRLWGAYTAPARRLAAELSSTPTTSRRRRLNAGRVPSPDGLLTPGFRGLYGGLENTDDAVLFEQAEDDQQPRR